jgi:hypothetical protein
MHSAGIPSIVTRPLANTLAALLSRLAILVLVAFHGVLLGVHALDGRLLDPGTSVRWVLGGVLLAGFLALRRLGLPVWWGRKAVVLWLLVVLLHCQAAASNPQAADVWASLPAAVVTVVADASLASVLASLGLLGLALRRSRPADRLLRRDATPCGVAPALLSAGFVAVTGPRPPPCAVAHGL